MKRTVFSSRYRYFISVAEHKSLATASEMLFVTASALSKSLSTLERHLEYRLFTRDNTGIRLTDQGQALYSALLKLQGSAEFSALERQLSLSPSLISIITDSLMCRQVERLLLKTQEVNYTDIQLVYVKEGDTLAKVVSGEVDMAILYAPTTPLPSSLISHTLPDMPLQFFASPAVIETEKKLQKTRLILHEDLFRHRIYPEVKSQLQDYTGRSIDTLTLSDTWHVVKLLMNGHGIALLPKYFLQEKLFNNIGIRPIDIFPELPTLKRILVYSSHRSIDLYPLVDELISE